MQADYLTRAGGGGYGPSLLHEQGYGAMRTTHDIFRNMLRHLLAVLALVAGNGVCTAQDPQPDPNHLAFLQQFWQDHFDESFVFEHSSIILESLGSSTYVLNVGVNGELSERGLYVQALQIDVAHEDFSNDSAMLAFDHSAAAGTIVLNSGETVIVHGFITDAVIDDLDPRVGPVSMTVFTPVGTHENTDEASVAAGELADQLLIAYGIESPDPNISGGSSSNAVACMAQYRFCLDAAAARLSACRKRTGAGTLIAIPSLCLASIACGPLAPACCLVSGGAAIVAHHLLQSACLDDYHAAAADCLAQLMACDPTIVVR